MLTNSTPIRLRCRNVSGVLVDTVIERGDAELGPNGMVLSFSLPSPGSPWGTHLVLDHRRNPTEKRVREIAKALGTLGIARAGSKLFHTTTKQPLRWETGVVLSGVSRDLLGWLDSHIPQVTPEEYGYFDYSGDLVFEGILQVS